MCIANIVNLLDGWSLIVKGEAIPIEATVRACEENGCKICHIFTLCSLLPSCKSIYDYIHVIISIIIM